MARPYIVVDVFSSHPLYGNPVAVVFDADDLTTEQMQAIARWTNLSETTFVLPATRKEADYALRIFTPDSELPFAGHPTLGSAHAVIAAGLCQPRDGHLVQECAVGLIPLTLDEGLLTLRMPAAKHKALSDEEIAELAVILNAAPRPQPRPAFVDVGPVWVIAEMDSVEALLALTPNFTRCAAFERRTGATGLSLYAVNPDGSIEIRSFAPSGGVNEDPVCGSGNGSVAAFRFQAGQIAAGAGYRSRQGRKVGRDGHIALKIGDDGAVFVTGACVTTAQGQLHL